MPCTFKLTAAVDRNTFETLLEALVAVATSDGKRLETLERCSIDTSDIQYEISRDQFFTIELVRRTFDLPFFNVITIPFTHTLSSLASNFQKTTHTPAGGSVFLFFLVVVVGI